MPFNEPIRDWTGMRVWVVGASSGIGAALARALIERGGWGAVFARNTEGLARA
jgi:NAD(P)-dependent dehydrogenase (short-subunit alcohol dehydrogenase family)